VRLTINGEPINYSLENERTLGEVVRGVQDWLAEAGFHVTGMNADTHDLFRETPDQWSLIEVGSVEELGVRAAHTGDMKIAHWRTVEKWLGMLEDDIRALSARRDGTGSAAPISGADALSELLSDFPETVNGMRANSFLPPGSTTGDRFEAMFGGQAAAAVTAWPPARLHEAAELIAELHQLLSRRLADASAPGQALKRCAAQIRESMTHLPEVSVLLQTGRDKAAMEIVIAFADVVQTLLGLVPFLPPDPNRGKLLSELTPFLRDLVSAFDAKDSVLIGDLLEYEITPRIERLAPVLEGAT
jgi:hypothetical protein